MPAGYGRRSPWTVIRMARRRRAKSGHGSRATRTTSEDCSVAGTIELEGSLIQTPAGGRVSDYKTKFEDWDGTTGYDVGQTIGLSGNLIDSLSSADIVKSTVIAPPADPAPVTPGATSGGANVTQATARKTSVAGSAIPQTGDASLTGVLSAGFAGLAALVSGLFVSRKRG